MIKPIVLLDIANIIMFIGNIPLIITVVKDYGNLRGFSLRGSAMMVIAMGLILGYLWLERAYFSLFLSIITFLYWLIIVISLVNQDGQLENEETGVKTSYIR